MLKAKVLKVQAEEKRVNALKMSSSFW